MEENETRKEECRKRAEERVRAGEAAQARIDALIERAGGPVMVVKNVEEADNEKKEQIMLYVRTISRRDFGGSVAMYFQHLMDTIDRLEVALYNTLNERDQLIDDLRKVTLRYNSCSACGHGFGDDEVCLECSKDDSKCVCRGVQEVENDGSKN